MQTLLENKKLLLKGQMYWRICLYSQHVGGGGRVGWILVYFGGGRLSQKRGLWPRLFE